MCINCTVVPQKGTTSQVDQRSLQDSVVVKTPAFPVDAQKPLEAVSTTNKKTRNPP